MTAAVATALAIVCVVLGAIAFGPDLARAVRDRPKRPGRRRQPRHHVPDPGLRLRAERPVLILDGRPDHLAMTATAESTIAARVYSMARRSRGASEPVSSITISGSLTMSAMPTRSTCELVQNWHSLLFEAVMITSSFTRR